MLENQHNLMNVNNLYFTCITSIVELSKTVLSIVQPLMLKSRLEEIILCSCKTYTFRV